MIVSMKYDIQCNGGDDFHVIPPPSTMRMRVSRRRRSWRNNNNNIIDNDGGGGRSTRIIDPCGRFLRSCNNQPIIMALLPNYCVLRGRPQGGRAMVIVIIDRSWNDDSNGGLIVIVDFGPNPNLECRFGARHSDCRGRFG